MSTNVVEAKLQYFVPPLDGSKPYKTIKVDPSSGDQKVEGNYSVAPYDVEVEDVRGKEDQFTLDSAGFQFFKAPAQHKSFASDAEIQAEYYSESIDLLKRLTGANRIVIFDHTIRRRRPDQIDDGPQKRQPVAGVHVDQTTASAIARVHRHLSASDVEALLKRRFQIVNLWRPIKHSAFDHPLALCDFRSVDIKKDLVPVPFTYPDRVGETFGVQFNPDHKWQYLKGMSTDEIILIKCYDSIEDGSVAVHTPHTSFEDPSTPVDAPLRESIELRALAFYD